jgi:hypothetical protein
MEDIMRKKDTVMDIRNSMGMVAIEKNVMVDMGMKVNMEAKEAMEVMEVMEDTISIIDIVV